ncbi:MAG: hypothetical protein ACTSRA_22710 [Promethearchaeota archaeon]
MKGAKIMGINLEKLSAKEKLELLRILASWKKVLKQRKRSFPLHGRSLIRKRTRLLRSLNLSMSGEDPSLRVKSKKV